LSPGYEENQKKIIVKVKSQEVLSRRQLVMKNAFNPRAF